MLSDFSILLWNIQLYIKFEFVGKCHNKCTIKYKMRNCNVSFHYERNEGKATSRQWGRMS